MVHGAASEKTPTGCRGVVDTLGAVGNDDRSPRVIAHRWGQLDVDELGELGDAKLWPGGGREWNWGETGTHHSPGIQPGDVQELLEHDPEVVVLSRGRELR